MRLFAALGFHAFGLLALFVFFNDTMLGITFGVLALYCGWRAVR